MNSRIRALVLPLLQKAGDVVIDLLHAVTGGRFIYVDVSGAVALSDQWVEIPFDKSLTPKKQIQKIAVTIPGARLHAQRNETFLPDGTIVDADVELKNSSGNWIRLHTGAHTVSDYDNESETFAVGSTDFTLGLRCSISDIRFVAVRLRARDPVNVSKIMWVDFNLK